MDRFNGPIDRVLIARRVLNAADGLADGSDLSQQIALVLSGARGLRVRLPFWLFFKLLLNAYVSIVGFSHKRSEVVRF